MTAARPPWPELAFYTDKDAVCRWCELSCSPYQATVAQSTLARHGDFPPRKRARVAGDAFTSAGELVGLI